MAAKIDFNDTGIATINCKLQTLNTFDDVNTSTENSKLVFNLCNDMAIKIKDQAINVIKHIIINANPKLWIILNELDPFTFAWTFFLYIVNKIIINNSKEFFAQHEKRKSLLFYLYFNWGTFYWKTNTMFLVKGGEFLYVNNFF